jgi:leucyl aminopeptidase (aminopeptidase T)
VIISVQSVNQLATRRKLKEGMIGSDKINIDGLDANGARTPVFRKGEWA